MSKQISACVVGASGFAGALAAELLWKHPDVELTVVTARSEVGRNLDDLYPQYRVPLEYAEFDPDRLGSADIALVGLPHAAAAESVASLRERDVRVVDLSADFRLDQPTYEQWYGPHPVPELIEDAVFGLPELHREAIAGSSLVASPGCYSTAAILALAPLARAGLIASAHVDGKSGVSGAGRAANETTHFVSVDENVKPYAVDGHRHSAEIDQQLNVLGFEGSASFVPHLLPIDQGLLASCYVEASRQIGADRLRSLYRDAYDSEPFVELVESPPGVREVRDTNYARISVGVAPNGTVLAFCAIDNLWKGAAGQAVQSMNLMLGLDERAGLQ